MAALENPDDLVQVCTVQERLGQVLGTFIRLLERGQDFLEPFGVQFPDAQGRHGFQVAQGLARASGGQLDDAGPHGFRELDPFVLGRAHQHSGHGAIVQALDLDAFGPAPDGRGNLLGLAGREEPVIVRVPVFQRLEKGAKGVRCQTMALVDDDGPGVPGHRAKLHPVQKFPNIVDLVRIGPVDFKDVRFCVHDDAGRRDSGECGLSGSRGTFKKKDSGPLVGGKS